MLGTQYTGGLVCAGLLALSAGAAQADAPRAGQAACIDEIKTHYVTFRDDVAYSIETTHSNGMVQNWKLVPGDAVHTNKQALAHRKVAAAHIVEAVCEDIVAEGRELRRMTFKAEYGPGLSKMFPNGYGTRYVLWIDPATGYRVKMSADNYRDFPGQSPLVSAYEPIE